MTKPLNPKDASEFDVTPLKVDEVQLEKKQESRAKLGIPENLKMSGELFDTVNNTIKQYVEELDKKGDKAALDDKLLKWDMAVRGEFDKSIEKPWDTSSEFVSTLTGRQVMAVKTSIDRVLSTYPYFICKVRNNKQQSEDIQDFINDRAKYDFDYEQVVHRLSDIAASTPGAIINPEWVTECQMESDHEIFQDDVNEEGATVSSGLSAFKLKYPTAESLKTTEGEYKNAVKAMKEGIKEKGYYALKVNKFVIKKNGPVINIIHPSLFGMYPFNATSPNLAIMVYKRLDRTYNDLILRERTGEYLEGTAQKIQEGYVSDAPRDNATDQLKKVLEEKKGIPDSHGIEYFHTKIYRIMKGLVRMDPLGEGIEKDYEFEYDMDEDVTCRFAPARSSCTERPYFISSIDPSMLSAWGMGIPEKIENPQDFISTQFRQVSDGNTVANVPALIFSKTEKTALERSYQEISFKPGKSYFLTSASAFQRIKTERIDIGGALSIIQYANVEADSLTGVNRALSGQADTQDPDAPGVKQKMFINQSHFLINQYVKNTSRPLMKAIRYVMKMYRQNMFVMKYEIEYKDEQGKTQYKELGRDDIDFLEELTTFDIKNQKVDDNLGIRIAESRQDIELLMGFEDVNQNPFAKRTLLKNHMLLTDRFEEEEVAEILTSREEVFNTMMKQKQAEAEAAQAGQEAQGNQDQYNAAIEQNENEQIDRLSEEVQ